MENTYWNSNGKYEDRVAALDRVIDDLLGDKKHITNSEKQKGKHYHIEMLRRGKNAYYRMFNDGDFPRTFARDPECRTWIGKDERGQWYAPSKVVVEDALNRRIEAAWQECLGNGYVRDPFGNVAVALRHSPNAAAA